MRDLRILLLLGCGLLALIACVGPATNNSANGSAQANSAPIATASPAVTAQADPLNGKQLYADNCMICHRDTAKGGPITLRGKKIKPDDLTRADMKTWPEEKWVQIIQEGAPDDGMPAFKDKLKRDEIIAIVNYLRSLG